jgi:hypothetical protein
MLVDRGLSHSVVHAGKYVVWSRIEIEGSEPIFEAECYFPHSTETKEHKKAWDELEEQADEYRIIGHLLIMGDFNAHTGLDLSPVDTAGRLLLNRVESLGLHMLNGTPTCKGSITRTEYEASGKCTSTAIDYVFVSQSLLPHVESMSILDDRMASDHHPILVKLRNLRPSPGPESSCRKVWRIEKIPHYKDEEKHNAFMACYATAFDVWSIARSLSWKRSKQLTLTTHRLQISSSTASRPALMRSRRGSWAANLWVPPPPHS